MIKKFYVFAWLLVIGAVAYSTYYGTFGAAQAIALGVGAAGLVYGFALWAVMNVGGQSRSTS